METFQSGNTDFHYFFARVVALRRAIHALLHTCGVV